MIPKLQDYTHTHKITEDKSHLGKWMSPGPIMGRKMDVKMLSSKQFS